MLTESLEFTENRACPQCSLRMKETQRMKERHSVFVWYECTVKDCSGQWLHRFPIGEQAGFWLLQFGQ